jgi:Tfp pilus assembly protein PilX
MVDKIYPMMTDYPICSQCRALLTQKPNSGFALVIALSLMAFVLLLLLSITTLVSVETSSSAMVKQRLLAQNNAMLGLQVALGNLQTAAGPDQRVTANAAIVDGVDASKANYTVVWDVDGATGGSGDAPLVWLASGEDRSDAATTGANATLSTWPMLVSARDSGNVEAVYAEPVSMINSAGNSAGEMAWWIGDDGVKAKFNLVESDYLRDATTDSDKRLGISARYGIEALEGFETAYDYADDSEGDLFVSNLRKTISPRQGSILNSEFADLLDDHFHDISFYSRGLLTNTRDGGLKQDLTYYFEGGNLGSPLVDTSAISTGGTAAMDRITWGQLKSFYNLSYDLDTSNDSISVRPQAETQAGVYPILASLNLNYGMTVSSNYDGTNPATDVDRKYKFNAHIRPWFVLANPYNTTLTVSNYRIRIDADTVANFRIAYDSSQGYVSTASSDIFSVPFADVLNNMIFVVPEVSLEPGEALYYCLSDSANSAYGYTFVGSSSTGEGQYYAPYPQTDIDATTPRQFVFEAENDTGIRSIRVGDTEEVTGDVIERVQDGVALNRLIRFNTLIDAIGQYSLRTYAGDSATLLDDEELLQELGQFKVDGHRYGLKEQGGWNLDTLPNDIFTAGMTDIGNDYWSRNNSPEVAATTFELHGAINKNPADTVAFYDDKWGFHDYDGWATDYNIRAPRMSRFRDAKGSDTNSRIYSKPTAYGVLDLSDGRKFSERKRENGLIDELSVTPSFKWGSGYSAFYTQANNVRLFDIPRLDDVTLQPAIASLAQLQHFNPGGWTEDPLDSSVTIDTDPDLNTLGYTPSYAIGNSYAAPQVPRDSTTEEDTDASPSVVFTDVSYILNYALFDRYFFSTIPQTTGAVVDYDELPNKRLVLIDEMTSVGTDETVRSTGTAAAENLFVDGAFNVNSTSIDAWYALLNSFRGREFGDKAAGQGIFPRSLNQSSEFVDGADSADPVDGTEAAAWSGWRHLEDDGTLPIEDRKLYQLAEAIVEEVKARGPFVSMSDFVNRRLVSNTDSAARTGLSGALQAALDRTFNNEFHADYDVNADHITKWQGASYGAKHIVDNEQVGSGIIYDVDGTTVIANATSASSMPGWVLQADLLQALEPGLSVRSDTFTIRSYGNVLDPITGKVSAEAYVEAVVQRIPDYVDTNNGVDAEVGDIDFTSNNKLAGRRFNIVDIRFLDQSEI